MVTRKVKLSNVAGWAGNAAAAFNDHTVVLDVPTGLRYHVIWINGHAGAGKKATDLIGEVRINVNGVTQRKFTLTELLKLNALNGSTQWEGRNGNVANTAFQIPIWFAEPWRKSYRSQQMMAWGTGNVSSFQVEFDITGYAAAAAGLIAPTFRAEVDNAKTSEGAKVPMSLISKWQKFQIPITQLNGWNEYGGLKDLQGAIQALHLTDANLSEFELFVDDLVIRADTVAGNAAGLAAREMQPDPAADNDCPARGMYDIVFDHDDVLENALPLGDGNERVKSVLLRLLEAGGIARNITCIAEIIGSPATS